MDKFNFTIIGAGVIGLSIAFELSKTFNHIVLVEKNESFGQEISSRNSEVIHAGLYYQKNSLKSRLCQEGKVFLYEYCEKNKIPFRKCGKILVAKHGQENELMNLFMKAIDNGVSDCYLLNKENITNLEPLAFPGKAIFSPSTGIIDTHAFMKSLKQKFEDNNGIISFASKVVGIQYINRMYKIRLSNNFEFISEVVINCAGLGSTEISNLLDIRKEVFLCKGDYFRISPVPKINHLLYPLPLKENTGLGVHVTIDLGGGVKLGPDASYVNQIDYKINERKASDFLVEGRKLIPSLTIDCIYPDMSGIRPKLQKYGETEKDFYITEETANGYKGFVNLLGIESPGLTASLAIAKYVINLL